MNSVATKDSLLELRLISNLKRGDSSNQIKLIQEWLSLHGISLSLDNSFGPATEAAVKKFQQRSGLIQNGQVDQATFDALIQPMSNVLKPIAKGGHTLASLTLAYAEQHLKEHPREIGGQNMGPWVRLYMGGSQGVAWPWCAGFACFCLQQAATALKQNLPFTPSYACTFIATSAEHNHILLREPAKAARKTIQPGSIFLVKQTATMWQHTGIVTEVGDDYFHTIEGNTNDEGSPEGYEVCERIRGYSRMDFVTLT